jgi:DNA polymerase III epsilon subunit-like protein
MTIGKRHIKKHIDKFITYCEQANKFVGHNIKFDIQIIIGQIRKIINEFPDTENSYKPFLDKFQMVGKNIPTAAYCTMVESKGISAEIRGTNKLKFEKLMEVHKLLFNQDVGGKLHNALVDISVTLRVYLKLTLGIDICESMTKFNENIETVTNNLTICGLIKPISLKTSIENVEFYGAIITGFDILS